VPRGRGPRRGRGRPRPRVPRPHGRGHRPLAVRFPASTARRRRRAPKKMGDVARDFGHDVEISCRKEVRRSRRRRARNTDVAR
jgi:hypothetical protein